MPVFSFENFPRGCYFLIPIELKMHKGTFEKAHVLLIEDSIDLRNSLAQILQSSKHGFSVEAVSSSVGFIARLMEGEADILLVDYDLSAGDASTIVKTVKEIAPFLPVILISKNFSENILGEAARIGADSYVPLVGVPLKMLPMILSNRIEANGLLKEATDSRRESTLKSFQLDILSSLVRKMIETRDLKSVMQELAEQIVKKLDMKAVSLQRFFKEKKGFAVYGIYPQGKLLRFVKKFFDISSEDFTFPFDPANCIVDQYTADRKPWIGYDFADVFGTTMPSLPARMIQKFAGVESIYNAPFYSNDGLLGGIVVGNARRNFTDEEIEAFNAIVHVSSLLFEYNESVSSQTVQNEKLKAIHEISIQLHENLEPDKLFEVIYEKLDDLIPADLVRLFLFDKRERLLRVERAVAKKGRKQITVPTEIPLGKGLIGIAAAERKPVLENNSHENPLSYYIDERPKLEHLMAVPVIHGAELLGVIALTRWRSERFRESDLSALEIFSSQFAIALHNSQLYDDLSRSEGLYRLVLQNVNDAVILMGNDRRILYVNPNFLNITGYEPGEVVGKEFDFLIHHDDRPTVGRHYLDRMNGEPAPTRYKFRFVKKSGEVGIAEYNVATIIEEGKTTGLLGVARDITDDVVGRSLLEIKSSQ
jgi:PAS domain S-box-containing protein